MRGCAGTYTVFGHIIDGIEVLDRMEKVPVGARASCLPTQTSGSALPAVLSPKAPLLAPTERADTCCCITVGRASWSGPTAQHDAACRVLTGHHRTCRVAGASDRPVNDIKITSVTVHANPLAG